MQVVIRGRELPGLDLPGRSGVHVGLQIGTDPVGLVQGDAVEAEWQSTIQLKKGSDGRDFAGAAVHGRRGERFVYLTWGEVRAGVFSMFRRAKIMLDGLPPDAGDDDVVVAELGLTDACGMPKCARVAPDEITWRLVR